MLTQPVKRCDSTHAISKARAVAVQETSSYLSKQENISKKEKKSINQKGGSLLSVLLPPALGVLESLLTK